MPGKLDNPNHAGDGVSRPPENPLPGSGGTAVGTILIADDNPDDAHHAKMIIGKLHIPPAVQVVSGGGGVFAYLERQGIYQDRALYPYPILLLLDLMMPGVNGFEVLKWLAARPEHRSLPVIVLSVMRELKEISQAYQLGARSFLIKPLRGDDLARALHATGILPESQVFPNQPAISTPPPPPKAPAQKENPGP